MTLAENMVVDAALLVNPDEQGEAVVYHPGGNAALAKSINAVVEWRSSEEQTNDRSLDDLRIGQMWILQDATLGIASPTREDEVVIDGALCSIDGDAIDKRGMWLMFIRRSVEYVRSADQIYKARL